MRREVRFYFLCTSTTYVLKVNHKIFCLLAKTGRLIPVIRGRSFISIVQYTFSNRQLKLQSIHHLKKKRKECQLCKPRALFTIKHFYQYRGSENKSKSAPAKYKVAPDRYLYIYSNDENMGFVRCHVSLSTSAADNFTLQHQSSLSKV